jgi:tRNA(fMet)-specific endonuclease VapC
LPSLTSLASRGRPTVIFRGALQTLIEHLELPPVDWAAALACGQIRATLERQGRPIGVNDLQAVNAVLVTDNLRQSRPVEDLRLINWLR